jgi:hypothetical protein
MIYTGENSRLIECHDLLPKQTNLDTKTNLMSFMEIFSKQLAERNLISPSDIVDKYYEKILDSKSSHKIKLEIFNEFIHGNQTKKAIVPNDLLTSYLMKSFPEPTNCWTLRKNVNLDS